MAREYLNEEMVASYGLEINGIDRTKAELAKLDGAIQSLRAARYNGPKSNVTTTAFGGGQRGRGDIFKSRMDELEGRVQTTAVRAMSDGMKEGQEIQTLALRASVTDYGKARMARGKGNGPGRDDRGDMIKALRNNVETFKDTSRTIIVGWHGWPRAERTSYISYQERGTRGRPSAQSRGSITRKLAAVRNRAAGQKRTKGPGVPAANSLGAAIPIVRERLRAELRKL